MSTEILKFNETGLQTLSRLMESMKKEKYNYKGSQGTPITESQVVEIKSLAEDLSLTEKVDLKEIDKNKIFTNRFELGKYISSFIDYDQFYTDTGLWAWLSCLYFDQFLAPKEGLFLLGSEYRYIPDNGRMRYYRHLLRMSCLLYQKYNDSSKLFLSIPCYRHSDFVEQSQKSKMLNNPKMIQLCENLFYDEEKGSLKSGIATNKKQPGSFRRLVSTVTEQLYMNYDLFEMNSENIIEILPDEFNRWKNTG